MKTIIAAVVLCAFANVATAASLFASNLNQVFELDPITGQPTLFSDLPALTLAFGNGSLFAGKADGTFKIDPITGQPTLFSDLPGLALAFEVVPIPATFWLFASALGILGWMRRKKQ